MGISWAVEELLLVCLSSSSLFSFLPNLLLLNIRRLIPNSTAIFIKLREKHCFQLFRTTKTPSVMPQKERKRHLTIIYRLNNKLVILERKENLVRRMMPVWLKTTKKKKSRRKIKMTSNSWINSIRKNTHTHTHTRHSHRFNVYVFACFVCRTNINVYKLKAIISERMAKRKTLSPSNCTFFHMYNQFVRGFFSVGQVKVW